MKKIILLAGLMTVGFLQTVRAVDMNNDDTKSITVTEDHGYHVSKGGMFIEPILTATQQDASVKTSQLPIINEDSSGNAKGYGLGLRFGVHASDILFLGVDGRYSRMQVEDSIYSKADADVYNIAPMIGLQTPLWGIRVMGAYVVGGENNPGAGRQGLDLKFKEASGWRAGAGFYIAAVSVNLEYEDLTYNSTDIQSVGDLAINQSTSIDANNRGYTVSVSFPIAL